jgi:small subunit ribosomal protein S27e
MAGNFLRVACAECDSEQIVFQKAATPVACTDCGADLVTTDGGKAAIAGEIAETVEAR